MRKLLLAILCLTITTVVQAEMKQALTLHVKSGGNIVYFLDTKPLITFAGQQMIVTVDDKSSGLPMQDITRWEIGEAEYTGVSDAMVKNVYISVYGNTVIVDNPEGGAIHIYDLDGKEVGVDCGNPASFTLPSGIFIISTSHKQYKIAIR